MAMTEQEFEDWIETEDGESEFYEYLFDHYPWAWDDKIIQMMESGDYIEQFMEHKGVTFNEA